ncbi:amino acid permease [Kribbella antibiotica]|uniref:Amino acid permease n=1 Tax=Kribbella antibiotica TaxID=190195 RepID=A0A4R4YJN4_9ACTN|nr:APC family permease [Kribbella antibiotica]TDD45066.1 amino acid permease [Kribbella antibiotica]
MGDTSGATATPATADRPELKRVMGPGLLLLFVIGDILGTGVYALTGKVAGQVGGAVWLPFLCAFVVALLTATAYLELVTKYPKAGGAAVYTHKAFGIHILTFMLTFAVMCSGLTSASSASKAFTANFFVAAGIGKGHGTALLITALSFMTLIAIVNLRGVGESVKANVVLTAVELTGLLIVIGVGAWALISGDGDTSRLTEFKVPAGESPFGAVTAATALAFFAMVGFEDSVNMAEETKDPVKIFPKVMLIGLSITGVIYVAVAISAITLVPPEKLSKGDAPLLEVIKVGAPGFPVEIFAWITMFAVANSALINMLMASRLLYGMSHEKVLPGPLGRVLHKRRTPWVAIIFTTLLAFVLIGYADLTALGGTTAFLLLCVFAIVNVAVLVLRRDRVEHKHFRAPTVLPVLGAVLCVYLASPLSGRATKDYEIAGWLMLLGLALWALTWVLNKYVFKRKADFDPSHLDPSGPVN